MSRIITRDTKHDELEQILGIEIPHAAHYPDVFIEVLDSRKFVISRVVSVDLDEGELAILLSATGTPLAPDGTTLPEGKCVLVDESVGDEDCFITIGLKVHAFHLRLNRDREVRFLYERARAVRLTGTDEWQGSVI